MTENVVKKNKDTTKYIIIGFGIVSFLLFSCILTYLVAVKVTAKEPTIHQNDGLKSALFITGGEFLTNLSDRGFIKISIEYELENREVKAEIEKRTAEVRDTVNSVLRSKTSNDIRGEKGMTQLRLDIRDAINTILYTGKVINVYFTDILVS